MNGLSEVFALAPERFRTAILMASGYAVAQYQVEPVEQTLTAGRAARPEQMHFQQIDWKMSSARTGGMDMAGGRRIELPTGQQLICLYPVGRGKQTMDFYLRSFFRDFPSARDLLFSAVPLSNCFPDPYYGFGIRYALHEEALEHFNAFLTALSEDPKLSLIDQIAAFRVDEVLALWNKVFSSPLLMGRYQIAHRTHPPIGKGAWAGLSLAYFGQLYERRDLDFSAEALRDNPYLFLQRNPAFWQPVRF